MARRKAFASVEEALVFLEDVKYGDSDDDSICSGDYCTLLPPVERPNAKTDIDSDDTDEEMGDIDHLPARMLKDDEVSFSRPKCKVSSLRMFGEEERTTSSRRVTATPENEKENISPEHVTNEANENNFEGFEEDEIFLPNPPCPATPEKKPKKRSRIPSAKTGIRKTNPPVKKRSRFHSVKNPPQELVSPNKQEGEYI